MEKVLSGTIVSKVPRSINWAEMRECCPLVYATLRGHMDGKSRKCGPSQQTLVKITGLCLNEINLCIKELVDHNYIEKGKEHNHCVYYICKITDEKLFDMFSKEFLSLEISPKTKCFYIKLQKYLLINKKDQEAFLKLTIRKIAKELGCSINTAGKHLRVLREEGVIEPSKKGGSLVNLSKIGQQFLLLQKDVQEIKKNQDGMLKKMAEMDMEIGCLKKKLADKEKETTTKQTTFAL